MWSLAIFLRALEDLVLDTQEPALRVAPALTLTQVARGLQLSYADNIWDRLTLYAADGRLPIDNNAAERMIRPVALGRNNWLFFGSERGGKAAANWMSIIGTCKRAGVEPFAYLSDVLRRLPSAKTGAGVRALLPDVWKPL